jgi:hypothetical protein
MTPAGNRKPENADRAGNAYREREANFTGAILPESVDDR